MTKLKPLKDIVNDAKPGDLIRFQSSEGINYVFYLVEPIKIYESQTEGGRPTGHFSGDIALSSHSNIKEYTGLSHWKERTPCQPAAVLSLILDSYNHECLGQFYWCPALEGDGSDADVKKYEILRRAKQREK